MNKDKKRAIFISTKLLGRNRPIIEHIVAEEDFEESAMTIIKQQDTETTIDRQEVLQTCKELLAADNKDATLQKDFHRMYLDMAFSNSLPAQMSALDASQPWILFWVANSMSIFDGEWLDDDNKRRIAQKAFAISPFGGPFGGGLGQLPHIAGTYAMINALALCDNIDGCWDKIDRKSIYNWLMSLKQESGGFKTCYDVGEDDTRGVYCAMSIASLLNIMTDELTNNVVEYLAGCQNYEGGFGGCPQDDEAHGGYTFCAVAGLAILNRLDAIDIDLLIEWCATKQYNEEKGFCGRSNKLVDGCYSFWVGGAVTILEAYNYGNFIMNHSEMKEYILRCCQSDEMPGLRDKPGKRPDFYHTNYVLSGLSCVEYEYHCKDKSAPSSITAKERPGIGSSGINSVNPVYSIPINQTLAFTKHFQKY